jgi:hypothetical protein
MGEQAGLWAFFVVEKEHLVDIGSLGTTPN